MKRVLTVVLLCILFLILDNGLIPFLSIGGFYPSLLFIFAISYSIVQDEASAIRIGILSGFLQDIYFYSGFGINMFTNMIVCILAAQVGKIIFRDKKLIPIITVFLMSIIKGSIVYVIFYVFKINMYPLKIPFISLYNMVIGIFVYSYVYKLSNKEFMKKDWKF